MPDGKPAVRVRVMISGGDIPGETTYTDEDGSFKFGGLLRGNFTVTVRADGYPTATEYVTIESRGPSGQTAQVVIYVKGENVLNNPMLADVPKEPLKKFQKAAEIAGKDTKGAIALIDEAIALYPNFALAYYEKGLLYQKENDSNKALAAFVKAIEIKPDFTSAKIQFGVAHNSLKNYEVAAQVFLDVIKQKTEDPMVYSYLGIAFIGLKQNDNAEKAFKQAITMKGGENLAVAHRYLGGIYMQKNQNTEAIAELQKYLELQPKATDADRIKAIIEDLKKKKS
jgi:tetratricopeptide (TPR) repeat protein